MKTVPATLTNTLGSDHAHTVGTIVHAEWPMNRMYRTVVDNTPSEDTDGFDVEYFPIESITENPRPTSGICKAVVDQSYVEPAYNNGVPPARFYTLDVEDQYKYWQSPNSAASGTLQMTNCSPQVLYVEEDDVAGVPVPKTVNVNKITFTVENTFASPTEMNVQVKYTTNGSWTTVSTRSNFGIPASGKVELWYNGTNWTTTKNLDNVRSVHAVRLVVTRMNKAAYFNLIELGLCLEQDLSADVADWSNSMSMGEIDNLTPLGTISSNEGSITLFNGDTEKYTNSNPTSPYYKLLDKGIIFRCWMKYNNDTVQEFEMFSDTWDEGDETSTVNLVDGSRFFMEAKPAAALYEDVPVQEAVWRICDMVGFNNYNVTAIDENAVINIFWTDGQKTAWETFAELSRATQTAIYFDSFGVLQVKTRTSAWNASKTPTYEFNREDLPNGKLSNIVTMSESNDYEANKVTVNWKPTGFSELRDNVVPFEVVWEPDGDVVLRSTELSQNLRIGDKVVNLATSEGKTWPWNGILQIEGEWIRFDAKRYTYYSSSGVRTWTWVTDYEHQKRIDDSTGPFFRHLNNYTGALRVAERGLWNSVEDNHYVDLSGWTRTRQKNYTTNHSPCAGITLNRGRSNVTVQTAADSKLSDYTYLHRGNGLDQGSRYVGFRMKIDKTGHKDKVGGLFFAAGDGIGSGYFLEVMATSRMDAKMRNSRNEVVFYSMRRDGTKRVFGGEQITLKDKSKNSKNGATVKKNLGARFAVPADRWIDFDLWYTGGTTHKVQVFANGRFLFEANIDGAWRQNNISRMGLYARGHSSLTFDYFYAINSPGVDMVDSESYYDRISGGYYSTQASDWTYDTRTVRRKVRKKWNRYRQRYNQRFYEEFGPMAHEIREFEVDFSTDMPVLESKLYFSNTSQLVCTEFTGDVKKATFIMANISRDPAVAHGDDERTANGNGTINHKLFVYGRPVIQKDSLKITHQDDWALRRRGPIELEYDSQWIQNQEEADRFGKWLTTNWSKSDSTLETEVYGNPLIELTDVVTVKHKHINAKYYVTAISNSYDQGLKTSLTLRKVGI